MLHESNKNKHVYQIRNQIRNNNYDNYPKNFDYTSSTSSNGLFSFDQFLKQKSTTNQKHSIQLFSSDQLKQLLKVNNFIEYSHVVKLKFI